MKGQPHTWGSINTWIVTQGDILVQGQPIWFGIVAELLKHLQPQTIYHEVALTCGPQTARKASLPPEPRRCTKSCKSGSPSSVTVSTFRCSHKWVVASHVGQPSPVVQYCISCRPRMWGTANTCGGKNSCRISTHVGYPQTGIETHAGYPHMQDSHTCRIATRVGQPQTWIVRLTAFFSPFGVQLTHGGMTCTRIDTHSGYSPIRSGIDSQIQYSRYSSLQ